MKHPATVTSDEIAELQNHAEAMLYLEPRVDPIWRSEEPPIYPENDSYWTLEHVASETEYLKVVSRDEERRLIETCRCGGAKVSFPVEMWRELTANGQLKRIKPSDAPDAPEFDAARAVEKYAEGWRRAAGGDSEVDAAIDGIRSHEPESFALQQTDPVRALAERIFAIYWTKAADSSLNTYEIANRSIAAASVFDQRYQERQKAVAR